MYIYIYAHVELAVACLIVDIFVVLSKLLRVWELRAGNLTEMFSYVSFTFPYLPGPVIQATDPSFFAPKFSRTNTK